MTHADLYPVPPDEALDPNFDLSGFTGRWFITAGLNPLFDTFDCQVGVGLGAGRGAAATVAAAVVIAVAVQQPLLLLLASLGACTSAWFSPHPSRPHLPPQEHFFAYPEPGHMKAQINWRISKPRGDFMQRSTIQNFVQVAGRGRAPHPRGLHAAPPNARATAGRALGAPLAPAARTAQTLSVPVPLSSPP